MDNEESYGRRLTTLAERLGDQTAIWFAASTGHETTMSWRQLESMANRVARLLATNGTTDGDLVVLGLPNSLQHVMTTFGAWKLGASVLSLRSDLPAWERDRLLDVAKGRVVVADWLDVNGAISSAAIDDAQGDDSPLPDRVPRYSRLVASSGSTGTPKIITTPNPAIYVETPGDVTRPEVETGNIMLGASPLYHTNGFASCYPPLLAGERVVLMERFDAERAVDLIERYRITGAIMVPTMLQRIARLPGIEERNLSTIHRVVYGAASLPEWVARKWLSLIPPERFVFMYGGTEGIGSTTCTGDEWLSRPGTVGTPKDCTILILDEEHNPVPAGVVGHIWMRRLQPIEPFRYVGVPTPEPILDGYRSFGDMGYVDEDGWLYIVDRRQDMIISGGANIFPAEVEAALSDHPSVSDVVVIGLPDDEWGHRVHAVVEPTDPAQPPTFDELRAWAKERLASYKVPKTVEIVERMPRTAAGKVNRTRMAEDRTTPG